jgi:hypothetical protein
VCVCVCVLGIQILLRLSFLTAFVMVFVSYTFNEVYVLFAFTCIVCVCRGGQTLILSHRSTKEPT